MPRIEWLPKPLFVLFFGVVAVLVDPRPVLAVPAFAAQTGQQCQTCHVGGFGPQLTPYGRNFKLGGYTQRGKKAFTVPLSVVGTVSYLRTLKDQGSAPAPGFGRNNNVAFDQGSIFVAGGLGSHLGAFVQTTYNGIAKAWNWDNMDVRLTTTAKIKGKDVVLGASLNNNPTVQDPWNTLPAWGFPFTTSSLAPTPGASPLISGALVQHVIGVTGYAWIDGMLYLEGGAYGSPSARTLTRLGVDPTAPGDLDGLAPYGRAAVQRRALGGVVELGALAFHAGVHPGLDRATGAVDRYTDLGLDASFQKTMGKHGDILTIDARAIHERQNLAASCALITAQPNCARNELTDLRAAIAYYWRNKVGATLGAFDTFGSANPGIYAANRTFQPDSAGATVQLDFTPFGDRPQPARRINVRFGLQYTIYTKFNGASLNFDGAGRRASDNNTFRAFTWLAF